MKTLFKAISLLLISGISHAANDAADASAALQQFHAALKSGDQKVALSLLLESVRIYESGFAETRDQYAGHHLPADMQFAKDTTQSSSDTQIDCELRLCVITQQSRVSGMFKGRKIDSKGVETAVLRLTSEGWKIAHLHWSNQ